VLFQVKLAGNVRKLFKIVAFKHLLTKFFVYSAQNHLNPGASPFSEVAPERNRSAVSGGRR
jgi:hypothetical protein